MFKVVNLKKSFNGKEVIKNIDLTIEHGRFISLLGPSGCGKTTLLRLIAGLEQPDQGRIVNGDDVFYSDKDNIFKTPSKREIGMVFQDFALWPHMTVFQNVAYPLKVRKDTNNMKERVMQALSEVQLADYHDLPIHQLSGGQQQRVSLARAIISQYKLILMDEPLSALDAGLREDMRLLIQRLVKNYHITAIFVTHDQYEAMTMSDEIAVIRNGKIVQFGSPESLYHHPKNKEVATFIGKGTFVEGQVRNNVFTSTSGIEVKSESDIADGHYGLLVRPELVHISEHGVDAKILTKSFTGERYQYTAQVKDNEMMFYDDKAYQIGDNIKLTFALSQNHFISMEG